MAPGEQVLGEIVIQELAVNEELDYASSEKLYHRLEPRERDVEEGSLVIKAPFKNQRVEVRIHGAVRRCDAQPVKGPQMFGVRRSMP